MAGVCGGLGEYFSIDPVIVRLAWAILTVLFFGTGVLVYLVAALVIPKEGETKGNSGCLIFLVGIFAIFIAVSIIGVLIGVFSGVLNFAVQNIEWAYGWHGFGFPGIFGVLISSFIGLVILAGLILLIVALVKRNK